MSTPEEILKKSLDDLKDAFVSQLDDKVAAIESAWQDIKNDDWNPDNASALRILVHSMAGTAGTFGFNKLSDYSRQLDIFLSELIANIDEISPDYTSKASSLLNSLLNEIDVLQSGGGQPDSDLEVGTSIETGKNNQRVLIVDPNTVFVNELTAHLENSQYEVRHLNHPTQIVQIAQEFNPQLIIISMAFPESDIAGAAAIEQIRVHGINTPVTYLSEKNDMQTRLYAYRTGADHFLSSPFDKEDILSIVQTVCNPEEDAAFRVLVVDDEEIQAETHAEILRAKAMDVEILTQPMQLLDKLNEFKPELVLMDINMPDCNGLEAAAILRQIPCYDTMPIVFLTSEQKMYKKIAAMNLGGDDFLVKPVTPDYLGQAVRARIMRARQLTKAQSSLQHTIDTLDIAKENAETANKTKTLFISKISHELRTPLNSVLGFAQLLKMDHDKCLSDKQQEHTHQILHSGWHLLALINDILDISRIESGRLILQPSKTSLDEVIEHSIDMTIQAASDKGVTIQTDIDHNNPCYVYADPTRLQQVTINLLSNAIKYNKDGGHINIYHEQSDNGVKLSVSDTGFGLPEDNQAELFTPFNRLGMENSSIKGTGIGLSICQSLVKLMHGSIGAYNNDDEGATFWFTTRPYDSQAQQEEQDNLKPIVLCIYESSAAMDKIAQTLADQEHYKFLTACDAQTALDTAKTHHPALILMDTEMATMDGLSLFGVLHGIPHLKQIPVIALSSPDNEAALKLCESGSVAGKLDKPCKIEELQAEISAVITSN